MIEDDNCRINGEGAYSRHLNVYVAGPDLKHLIKSRKSHNNIFNQFNDY